MLDFYAIQSERLTRLEPGTETAPAWIDLLNPTPEEEKKVERLLGIDVPTREEMAEIEISSRLYRENDALYMTASLIVGGDGPDPQTCPVTFILAAGRLVTVRYAEPGIFRSVPRQAQKADSNLKGADGIFIALLEAVIDRTADLLEKAGGEMDAISRTIFQNEVEKQTAARDYKAVLRKLGRNGDLNSRARESLVSIGRLVNFLNAECGDLHPELRERTETIAADIRSLTDHASYIAGTTIFLLDAMLGLINIEQNAIIKIVSVVAVLIMPPTLIASIYGMNFEFMPETGWQLGYPLALVAMIAAAGLPYWYFKRRGWL
jgi:magnesium transporter